METLTMQGIADLAQVKRSVVTMWRSRFKDSEYPFPQPVDAQHLRFNAVEIAQWLTDTEHGNNSDACSETSLHSSALNELAQEAEDASALLLLQELLGEPVAGIDVAGVSTLLAEAEIEALVTEEHLTRALANRDLVNAADTLAEAAFGGSAALHRLVSKFTEARGAWKAHALTEPALSLFGRITHELGPIDDRAIEPHGAGGLVLARALLTVREPHESARFVAPITPINSPEQRVAWRLIASERLAIEPAEETASARLVLIHEQAIDDPLAFFMALEEIVISLGPGDAAIVIGPAKLLVDDLAKERALAAKRAELLTPSSHYTAPLRYVGMLPKGLSRFGGRRRLGLWVFGSAHEYAGKHWTAYGDHTDTALTEANVAAINSDIVTAIAGGESLPKHAFLHSALRETAVFARQDQLRTTVRRRDHVDGSERLARVWELDNDVLPKTLILQSGELEGTPRELSWADVVPRLIEALSGYRVPNSLFEYPVAPLVATIGPEELRAPVLIGARKVNRLQLAQALPDASFTMPGDVVYTTTGEPAAWVDELGGHLVLAPARVLRVKRLDEGVVELHPQVIARDIELQAKRERASWRFRTLPPDELRALASATSAIAERCRDLTMQLKNLTALEQELIDGLTAGTLSVARDTNDKN